MKISVAVCTYNGERYIKEQLDSIINQSVSIDEIVICDDHSSDQTVKIIEDIKSNTDIPIRVNINSTNLGPSKNFETAIHFCKGDIIFLSDQDDVWEKDKVKIICNWFEKNPDKNVVFTNASLIDERGNAYTEYCLWDCVNFDRKLQRFFDSGFELETFFLNKATGATMALRREARNRFSQLCDNVLIYHDYCLCLNAINSHSLGYLPHKVMKYRCHSAQQSGIKLPNQPPAVYYHQYRLINIIPEEFAFSDESIIRNLDFYKRRLNSSMWECLVSLFSYFPIYKCWAVRFWFYDLLVKVRQLFNR